jgi:hypothetical protein
MVAITSLFDGKVGPPFEQSRLNDIMKEGAKRYENKVPPGYGDSAKGVMKRYGNVVWEQRYGDLVMWYQIINKAKESKISIVFVTDDKKADWWWKDDQSRTIGPRPELITEMKMTAGVAFYMYTPNRFMDLANQFLGVEVSEDIISEVRGVTEAMNWREEIANALRVLGGKAHLSAIYEYIQRTTPRQLPESWRAIVRNKLQNYASNCEAFLGKEDTFTRLGGGYWELKSMRPSQSSESTLLQYSGHNFTREELDEYIRSHLQRGFSEDTIVDDLAELEILPRWTRRRLQEILSETEGE